MPPDTPDNQPEQQTPVPAPPRLHWGWVLLLSCLTLGFFGFFWLILQASWAQKIRYSKALPFSVAVFVSWILLESARVGTYMLRGSRIDLTEAVLLGLFTILVAIVHVVLYCVAIYTLRSELQSEPIGLKLGPVMTFFFSSVYFQYHLMDYGTARENGSEAESIATEIKSRPTSTFGLNTYQAPPEQQASAPAASAPAPVSAPFSDAPTFAAAGSRYSDLATHELWQLLDDMDDERTRARRRESFYISTIVYLLVAWFVFYGPHVLWHQPYMINPADALKNREMTYLDLPPDALKQMKPKTPAQIQSDKDRIARTPKPTLDKKTLEQLRAMQPAAPPTPTPPQQQPQEQASLPPAPQPQPAPIRPQQPDQSMLEAPKPQPTRPAFNQPSQSAGENIRQLAENAVPTHGLNGGFGENAVPHHQGLQGAVEVLSDTSGVDPDELQKYLKRLYYEVYNNWMPLIPEEARPPLNKQGETQIRFIIQPNGVISAMYLDDSTHDDALNHAAWGSITGLGQLPPLPKGMKDPNLVLRYHYFYNPPEQ